MTIYTTKSIGRIEAEENYAGISITGGAADLDSLFASVGDFGGSLSCRKITGAGTTGDFGLEVMGDLEADITQTAVMDTNFRIWGSLASGADISLPANGLTHQIVINNDNNSFTWSGNIRLNGTALSSQPYYTNTAASIGGGSAGLVAFNLHGKSCVPEDGSEEDTIYPSACPASILECDYLAPNVSEARTWATMRLYGPVVFNLTGGQKPCKIERRLIGGSTWTDVTSDFRFDIYTSSDGMGTPDAGERVVRIRREGTTCLTKWFPAGYDYRVTPESGRVKCKGVDGGNGVNVASFEYNFTLPYDCGESLMMRYNLNEDETLDEDDLAMWAEEPVDFDGDTDADEDDLGKLFNAITQFAGL